MIIRKNISIEEAHLRKLRNLTEEHGGNLSAAIRDAIDIAYVALQRYGSVQEAISGITSKENKSLSEEYIQSGKCVLLERSIFLWMLKWTKGIPLEIEVIDELLDPLKIVTISDLDKRINEICHASGWKCEVSIFCVDNINPSSVTLVVEGDNEFYRDFVAHIVVMFLVYHKNLDIEVVQKRTTALRIDMKSREQGVAEGAIKHFGYLKEIIKEFTSKNYLWNALAELFSSVNYNMVVLHKNYYEDLLACETSHDAGIFESISGKHISSIPHSDFLIMLKKVHESTHIIDRIELFDHGFNVYHSYKNDRAIEKLRDYYLSLLKANGHEYEARYSKSLIVLNHLCCRS